jgi:hypothetical protein
MIKNITFRYVLIWLLILSAVRVTAQQFGNDGKLKYLENHIVVNTTPEEAWQALASFGNVSNFNAAYDESVILNDTPDEVRLGAEREVLIPDGVMYIINKERIVTLIEGVYYTYEVYETENFPTKKMWVTYGVRLDHSGRTLIFSKVFYEFNNVLATTFLKGKLKRYNMDSLMAYKNFIETGEKNKDIKELRKLYQHHKEDDMGLVASQ